MILPSPYFKEEEFFCPCCEMAAMQEEFLEAIYKLRAETGIPMRITSGFRCKRENTRINGSKNSYHVRGRALDWDVTMLSSNDIYELIYDIQRYGLSIIYYPKRGFMHLDNRKTPIFLVL